MEAIFKKEFRSYFYSPIGYVFIAIFFFVASLFFSINNLFGGSGDINMVFDNMILIFLFLTPVITMRLIAEEKNAKTDQLLFTAPIKVSSIVLGKFFAAISIFAIAMALTVVYPLLLASFTEPDWGKMISNYVGFMFMGAAFVSIGLYISSLTENQIIAAVTTFGVLFLLYLIDLFGSAVNTVSLFGLDIKLSQVISAISLVAKFKSFSMGVIDIGAIVFYIGIVVIFVYLTVFHIEKKRWSK
ncbi:MAG: ABC transporter permease subunit [Clostridia bacterium]|nr:ABC transporter permease subunit [Clostridia bacterium]